MAESLTYDSLLTDVELYAERSDADFVAQIPRFVMMAENRIASEVRGLGLQRYATGTMTLGDPILPKPNRWRETVSINITTSSGRVFLQERTYDYCRAFWPDITQQGEPRYYANYGYEHLFVVGSPSAAYPFELAYYERPEPLSESNQTSWTTQYAPQLLLYATLLEAQPFLKNPEKAKEFMELYNMAKQAVGQEDTRRVQDRAAGARRDV